MSNITITEEEWKTLGKIECKSCYTTYIELCNLVVSYNGTDNNSEWDKNKLSNIVDQLLSKIRKKDTVPIGFEKTHKILKSILNLFKSKKNWLNSAHFNLMNDLHLEILTIICENILKLYHNYKMYSAIVLLHDKFLNIYVLTKSEIIFLKKCKAHLQEFGTEEQCEVLN
jgi:hypothetical protein